jgi:hypothetical protein
MEGHNYSCPRLLARKDLRRNYFELQRLPCVRLSEMEEGQQLLAHVSTTIRSNDRILHPLPFHLQECLEF